MRVSILATVAAGIVGLLVSSCATLQSPSIAGQETSYEAANSTLVDKYGFKLDLPRERWPKLSCDLNVNFSESVTWWRLCYAEDKLNRTGVIIVTTKNCFQPEVIEKRILGWYAGKNPYSVLKKESSDSQEGFTVTNYTIQHVDHQDFLAMAHIGAARVPLVLLAATGKDKQGREEDFRSDFELAVKGLVVSKAATSSTVKERNAQ